MATVLYIGFVVITLALGSASASASTSTSAKFSIPFLGDKVCKVVVCGKGKCVASNSSSLGYECECEKGWTQRPHDSNSFKFLPCVVPYCAVNFSGDKAPAPAPAPSHNKSSSFIDPCSWTNCGGGTCKKTSMLTHTCECNEGYYNMFNSTSFPCKKRAIGGDSPDLGNNMTNSSDPSPGQSSSEVADSASSFITCSWLIAMPMFAMSAPFLWNYS